MSEFLVVDEFPEHRSRILRLLQEEPDFEELCADYDEISMWLAITGVSHVAPAAEIAEARRIQQSLRAEILEKLQAINPGNDRT